MNQQHNRSARAALFLGAALIATPAFAQDTTTVAPPPVQAAPAQTAPPQPAPPVQVTPPPIVPTMIQAVPDTPKPQTPPAEYRRAATARPAAARAAPRVAARPAPALRAAPPAPAPEAAAPAPAEAAPAPAAPVAQAPAPAAPAAPTVTESRTVQTASSGAIWPWLLGGALLAAAAIAFLLSRRRREDDDVEEYYEERAAIPEPAAETSLHMAPVPEPVTERPILSVAQPTLDASPSIASPEDATVAEAASDDLAGIADGDAPVSNRPWLELGMRPLRAGTQAEEALVEIELIVGNAGDMPAEDVRISTFMLPAGKATSEMENLLIERANETAVPPVTIAPGEGKTVDATLAVHKADLAGAFEPVVVADARYRLPDGSEGRTSASFRIGLTDADGNGLSPISTEGHGMNENVVAELHGAPARA